MGRFKQEFSGYENYDDTDCYSKSVPTGLPEKLAEFFSIACENANSSQTVCSLRAVANDLSSIAGNDATQNWEPFALKADILSAYFDLRDGRFDKFMDATLNAVERVHKDRGRPDQEKLICKINDILIGTNFGYTIRCDASTGRLTWDGRFAASAAVSSLSSTGNAVADFCCEATEHIEQAKSHLLKPDRARSRKDAVRDAMSALEAFLKKLANENDLHVAVKKLRDEKVWGPDRIIKDGSSIWNDLHHIYPDVRHGQQASSDLDLEEAIYWINRISAYIEFLTGRKHVLGR